ncbi:MAG: fumarylacetoacetate hydrolase family protein [Parvibaculum sp.]|uniref:2-keto-4-pentenoate hydratase n=1 Tax=Parvibaculum sp. TaxID=2024848 RepID=UPI0025EAB9A3|nr:fumarylacetoacetate hydrolase family protein [Parvibaculum sp.]MCE9650497.1 fumarylacetoacetate hydrolase family protein [Parvibaculum sp.]
MPPDLEMIAAALADARRNRIAIPPITETSPGFDVASAYAVQEINTRKRLAAGERIVGRKIGLTSPAVQTQLGVDEPDYGMLFDRDDVSDAASVAVAELMQPKIEAEIAFVLDKPLKSANPGIEEVASAIGYAVAAAEIVDSAIADWRIKLADTVADNASGAKFVLGKDRRKLSEIDLHLGGMEMCLNGKQVSVGVGAACLGNPLNAARWLARKMAEVGRPLDAGDIILSGALGPMANVAAGHEFAVHVQGFKPLHVVFA